MTPQHALTRAVEDLGNPEEIASGYREARPLFVGKLTFILFILNSLFFLAGIAFLYLQDRLKPEIKEVTWRMFAEKKVILLFLYALSWLFMGIYLGRQYGFKVKKRINGD